jgi:hypothetical protein
VHDSGRRRGEAADHDPKLGLAANSLAGSPTSQRANLATLANLANLANGQRANLAILAKEPSSQFSLFVLKFQFNLLN